MNIRTKRYILTALDPLHVGTGGYRLGMVDQSIVREPGTNLPKIPGTSLHGAIRSHAAHIYNKIQCAGAAVSEKGGIHCGKPECPICYTFGHITEESTKGVVSIGDARILFFPVYSMKGPVWVSTKQVLTECGIHAELEGSCCTTMNLHADTLNLGWLMIHSEGDAVISMDTDAPEWVTIKDRIVVVPDALFSQIVNSNLEIRTSVSISPETGAAEETDLFTFEAIPRSTFLWVDMVEDNYKNKFPKTTHTYNGKKLLPQKWGSPLEVVEAGLYLAEHLGIGGMVTRGFGRVRTITNWEV
jgi:CRISPR-associated protein Cmr4